MNVRYFLIVVLLTHFLTGINTARAASEPDCAALLRNRCQSCHYLDRVCSQVSKKSKRNWKATLKRMVKRRGAELSKEEQVFLVNCLLLPAPDIKKECATP